MAIKRWLAAALMCLMVLAGTAAADEKKKKEGPWEKAYLNLGWYWASLDSGFEIRSQAIGIGINIDVEDTLGLKTDDNVFRVDAGWRFTKNKRHKVEFSWFRFDREGSETLDVAIEIPDGEDGTTTIGPGRIDTVFKFDIYKLKYEYSFILDDRIDLNAGIGLFIMPIEFGFSGVINGVGEQRVAEEVTAPLPVFGLGFDVAITPKWFIRQQTDIFYLEIGQFKGSILASGAALEYLPWKHVGFGAGADFMRVRVEAEGEDYPEIDFKGSVQFTYFGAQLYVKFYL